MKKFRAIQYVDGTVKYDETFEMETREQLENELDELVGTAIDSYEIEEIGEGKEVIIMKKFKVEYRIDNEGVIAGYEPTEDIKDSLDDYVDAESKEEAIALAIQWIIDQTLDFNFCEIIEQTDDCLVVQNIETEERTRYNFCEEWVDEIE